MSLPVPVNPQWPDKNDTHRPHTELLPLVNPTDAYTKQLWDWLKGRPRYLITEDYYTYAPMLKSWVWIPRNMVIDYASIPRLFTIILRPAGLLSYGAVPHDFGYRFNGLFIACKSGGDYTFIRFPRSTIDNVFADLNKKASALGPVIDAATWAVKTFAGGSYGKKKVEDQDWTKPVY